MGGNLTSLGILCGNMMHLDGPISIFVLRTYRIWSYVPYLVVGIVFVRDYVPIHRSTKVRDERPNTELRRESNC
jgi:hypothetical protein